MKIKYYLCLLIVISLVTACVDDAENNNLVPVEQLIPLVIEGVKDTTVVIGQELHIKPTLKNMDDENRYEYLWYASNTETQGVAPSRDTLSMERDLSVKIQMESGTYNLVYIVRDPKIDIYVRESVIMTIGGSEVSKGWYVLKEIDNKTDFDFISEDGKIITNVLGELAGQQDFVGAPVVVGNQQLEGKPVKIIYQKQRYYHEVPNPDGTNNILANQRVLHILSDKDYKTFNADNLFLFKDRNEHFYEIPNTVSPNDVCFFSFDLYLINEGKLHAIYGMSSNVGKYSYAKVSEYSPNYRLHRKMVASFYGTMVFDTVSRTFFNASASGSTLNLFSEPTVSTESSGLPLPSLKNMDYDLINFIEREHTNFERTGYALLRSRSSESYYLASFVIQGDATYPFVSFREIPAGNQFPEAPVLCAPQVASCVYFAKDNTMSCYIDASDLEQRERVIKTFPADETIVNISNLKREYLTVLTNNNEGWKLYAFNIVGTTPDIEPEPKFVFEGKGRAQSLMLR